jgi:hypothetical protein
MPTQYTGRCKRLLVTLTILMTQTVRLSHAQSCSALITDLQNWLTQNANNRLAVTVSSHRYDGQVSYAVPVLKAAPFGTTLTKIIVTSTQGTQYFSDKMWWRCPSGQLFCDFFPFSPDATKKLSVIISDTNTVTVKPNGGAQTHKLSGLACVGPYLYGFHVDPTKLYPYGPKYTLTFIKQSTPDPIPPR